MIWYDMIWYANLSIWFDSGQSYSRVKFQHIKDQGTQLQTDPICTVHLLAHCRFDSFPVSNCLGHKRWSAQVVFITIAILPKPGGISAAAAVSIHRGWLDSTPNTPTLNSPGNTLLWAKIFYLLFSTHNLTTGDSQSFTPLWVCSLDISVVRRTRVQRSRTGYMWC